MRIQSRFFIHFLSSLMVLLCSGVIVADDGTLDFTNEPTDAQLNSDPMYVTPSKGTVETLIQWSNSCKDNVHKLLNNCPIKS